MKFHSTDHAKKRMRQRGFSDFTMNIVIQYGRYEFAPGGALKIFMGNKDHQKLVAILKKDLQLLDSAKGGTVIVSDDGKILTTYKNKQPNYSMFSNKAPFGNEKGKVMAILKSIVYSKAKLQFVRYANGKSEKGRYTLDGMVNTNEYQDDAVRKVVQRDSLTFGTNTKNIMKKQQNV